MLQRTGCDMVMIGRGAMGYPFIFKECNEYLKKGKEFRPSIKDRHDAIFQFLDLYKNKQKRYKFSELKQHLMWACKWLKGAKTLRVEIMKTHEEQDAIKLIEDYFKERM